MIRVQEQREPDDFQNKVESRGQKALSSGKYPNPSKLPPFWRECIPQLLESYQRVCAYTSLYIHPVTGSPTVDHFVPRRIDPSLAYKWSNFRLACGLVNSRKGTESVLDPFKIENGWFRIDFNDFRVVPDSGLDEVLRAQVVDTIAHLGLDKQDCRDARKDYFVKYATKDYSYAELRRGCPFLEREMRRQGFLFPEDREP